MAKKRAISPRKKSSATVSTRQKPAGRTVTMPGRPTKVAIPPPSHLSIEVLLPPAEGGLSPFSFAETINSSNVHNYRSVPGMCEKTARRLQDLGFRVIALNLHSISVESSPALFTKTFGTKLQVRSIYRVQCGRSMREKAFHEPADGATWELPPALKGLVERAYIQQPAIYLQSPLPPKVNYFHLNLADVAMITRAKQVHQQGITGKGVRVLMIDSGFFNHAFYQTNGFKAAVVLGPGALNPAQDSNGHGTAQAANVFANAPGITFAMLKQGPNAVAALKKAIELGPDIIITSWCFDMVEPGPSRKHRSTIPSSLKALEMTVASAVAKGISVVCAAGNGQVAFPGMHPDVISAGGVFVGSNLTLSASDLSSAYDSRPYPGRHVPDLCGLVGMRPAGVYIMLPLQAGSTMDQSLALGAFPNGDGTAPNDGWIASSGTSSAAPQIAGVCALLKQKNPSLTPQEIKQALIAGAVDCGQGLANPDSNQGTALNSNVGPDGATGHGLVNAAASVALV